MKLSIIIPAYNEEKRIFKTLKEYYSFFIERLGNEFELIIVTNNCNDNTLEITKKFSKDKKNVIIKDIPFYTGKGGAIIEGFRIAHGELIGFVDADNSTNSENFHKLVENIKNFDGIIASRKIKGAKIDPKRNLSKNSSSYLFMLFVKIIFGLKYKDTQCGAKLFKKDIAKFIYENLTEKGCEFDVNLLYLCKKNNFKIREYPIYWTDCNGSKLTNLDGIKSILNLTRYRIKLISSTKSPKLRTKKV